MPTTVSAPASTGKAGLILRFSHSTGYDLFRLQRQAPIDDWSPGPDETGWWLTDQTTSPNQYQVFSVSHTPRFGYYCTSEQCIDNPRSSCPHARALVAVGLLPGVEGGVS